jgi:hypothetical protein
LRERRGSERTMGKKKVRKMVNKEKGKSKDRK